MKTDISIIIPVFNTANYISQCVDSIRNQTLSSIEIILVDDGSTDDSGQICDMFANQDHRIHVLHTQNGGTVLARKRGLSIAKGDYIGFVDADDYVSSNMFECLVKKIKNHNADFVACNYFVIDDEKQKKSDALNDNEIVVRNDSDRKAIISEFYFGGEHLIPYGLMFKVYKKEFIKQCFEQIPEEQQYGEDSLILLWMLIFAKKFVTVNDAYYHYRVLDKSVSHFESKAMIKKEFELSCYREEILKRNAKIIDEDDFWKYTGKRLKNAYENRALPMESLAKYAYYYPKINVLRNKKIIVYGAGRVGTDYFKQFYDAGIEVVAVTDKKGDETEFFYSCRICKPNEIVKYDFDYIVIAILDEEQAMNIREELLLINPDYKIIWERPEVL